MAPGLAALAVLELTMGAPTLRHPLAYVIAGALALAAPAALGRIRIRVVTEAEGTLLRVDDTRLPVAAIADVRAVDAAQRRDLLGRHADPLAFVIQRPWVPGGVRIDLDDPDDPTPYWYISSRHPERLAQALLAAKIPPRRP